MKRAFKREYFSIDFMADHMEERTFHCFLHELFKELGCEDMKITARYDRNRGMDVLTATWIEKEGGEK